MTSPVASPSSLELLFADLLRAATGVIGQSPCASLESREKR